VALRRVAAARHLALACLILASFSCSDNPTAPEPPVLTSITVAISPAVLTVGQTVTGNAAGVDQHGAAMALGTVLWSTSAPAVATVNSAGVVTAVGAGSAQIVATVEGRSGQQMLTVNAARDPNQ